MNELAQIYAARLIHQETGRNTTLEFHLEKGRWGPNAHYYVDIVMGDGQMWEVKPWRDSPIGIGDGYYEVAEAQLDKYASINSNLTRGAQYEDILGIEVVGDLHMDIQFFDQGKIRYSFYLQHEDDVYALTTSRAEDYIEANNSYPPKIIMNKILVMIFNNSTIIGVFNGSRKKHKR